MTKCRNCAAQISPFMSFGKMPIANAFIPEDKIKDEYFFEMETAVCEECKLFQLIEQPSPEKMFHGEYAFFSQTSKNMAIHFEEFANETKERFLNNNSQNPFVVELGSNDGIMLRHFAKDNIHHLGVEPSANVAEAAQKQGVNTLCSFFNKQTAEQIIKQHGNADIIQAANVVCHIPDIISLAEGIKTLLKPEGVFIFQEPYLGDVISKTSYDQIYDEHVFLFSLTSVANIFKDFGLELIDAKHVPVHGGSMRYFLGKPEYHEQSQHLLYKKQAEETLGLHDTETFHIFKRNCENSKKQLVDLLTSLKNEGKTVAGYAATSKSTTILNYCGIDKDLISYISDTTPIKQNKLSPGMHIPIKPYEHFKENYPDYAVLFAWNHMDEIFAKEQAFRDNGGKWILFVPEVIVK